MSKITGPLLSLGARGTIGKTATFSSWRGVPYVRTRVIPSNPQTSSQQATRTVFKFLSDVWKVAPADFVAPWNAYATGRAFLGRNAFIGQNVALLRGETDLLNFVGSPGARGGLPPDQMALTPGDDQIVVDFTTPVAPTGWTLAAAVAAAIPDQDPSDPLAGSLTIGTDTSAPINQVTLTGLGEVLHAVVGWLVWTKPDLSTAYSASLLGTATPT